jgi:hypothetical protein
MDANTIRFQKNLEAIIRQARLFVAPGEIIMCLETTKLDIFANMRKAAEEDDAKIVPAGGLLVPK